MTCWVDDPTLFLYKEITGLVYVFRCMKETTLSSSSMLMKIEDFTCEGEVTDHLSLYGHSYNWDKNKYEALVDYIYSNHFMVNYHGSVIVVLPAKDWQEEAAPRVSDLLNRKKKAATTPRQVVCIRALDILDMGPYSPHPANRVVPARMVKYLQDGTVVQMEPNQKEMKLAKELSMKSKEVETLQQELANEKTEMEVLIKRVVELEESVLKAPVRIYTKAATEFSLTIDNNNQVIFRRNNKSDLCQYWMKDDKYGATVKDVCGYPCYALVNKFTGQALKPSGAGNIPVELVSFNPNVLDKSILWSEVEAGDGYRVIRKPTNPCLVMDGCLITGGVGDGTIVHLWNYGGADNQKWNIVPY